LTQARLKLLIAYSTVAQIGYMFLIFPLAKESNALAGGILQAISHALAKAAMFMAAGLMTEVLQHDRIADLRGIGRALPVTALAFVLAAVSLVGVPPSGGFLAKWLLLSASFAAGQWWWAAIILTGALLAGGYMFRAFAPALADSETPLSLSAPVSRTRELVVMALAICALLIGMFPQTPLELLRIGRAHHAGIALP
jgi:multicomponent Na+:H+ antiporter subunit D